MRSATAWRVFNGDVTDYASFEPFEQMDIDTVFNCAANVKAFSNGTDIEDINVGGVVSCIRLCKKINARLIHFPPSPSRAMLQMISQKLQPQRA